MTKEEKIAKLEKTLEGAKSQLGKFPTRIVFTYLYDDKKNENSIYLSTFKNKTIKMDNIKYADLVTLSMNPNLHSAVLGVHEVENISELARILYMYNEKWVTSRKKHNEPKVHKVDYLCAGCGTRNSIGAVFGEDAVFTLNELEHTGPHTCKECGEDNDVEVNVSVI